MPRAVFYSGLRDMKGFNRSTWYGYDVQILQRAGFDVHVSKSLYDIPLRADLYFAWWPTTGVLPYLAARLSRRPFVVVAGTTAILENFGGLEKEIGYYSLSWPVRKAITTTLAGADCVMPISAHAASQAERLGARRKVVVPCCVDTELYRPDPSLNADASNHLLCIITELCLDAIRRKRLEPTILAMPEILRSYPETKLRIVGRPADAMPTLLTLVERCGLSRAVEFAGMVSEAEKVRMLQGAFAYLQPTIHETFGVAIAEAMSCGRPVITSPVAAVPELVEDCGLYAPADDSHRIAECAISLLADRDRAATLGARGRARIEAKFSFAIREEGIRKALDGLWTNTSQVPR